MKELNNFRQFLAEGKKEIKEGTWSLGSLREMAATMTLIRGMMRETDPTALLQTFEDLDNIMYNVFGDDGFHDYLGAAHDAAEEGDMDRAKNALGDALGRAMELYKDEEAYRKDRGETGFEFKPRFGLEEEVEEGEEKKEIEERTNLGNDVKIMRSYLADITHLLNQTDVKLLLKKMRGRKEDFDQVFNRPNLWDLWDKATQAALETDLKRAHELLDAYRLEATDYFHQLQDMRTAQLAENDSVLDEIIGEEKEEVNENMQMFREIDDMLSRAAIHMDGEDFADELIQEFEAISGAAPILHKALKNIMANNGIPEANPEEDQAIINKRNKR